MKLLNQLKRLWRALRGTPNSWPAIDLSLPGGRHLHLVGSIHMGDARYGSSSSKAGEKATPGRRAGR
ncbi:GumN family protein [Salmonella enterica subsp. enterica]|nr:GumN family protein [Salmonella enterica subsp. enterica]